MCATNSINNVSSFTEKYNKSRFLIDSLISESKEISARFFSYDNKIGIYRVLSKVLSSAPQIVKDFFDADQRGDKVPDFANWLYSNNKFSVERLLGIRAEHDASLFQYVKTAALNAVKDLTRDLENKNKKDPLNDKLMAEDMHNKFERMDLLKAIFSGANLSKFQTFIYQKELKGFSPEEIIQMYHERYGKQYSMSAYYTQKSRAMARLRETANTYRLVR